MSSWDLLLTKSFFVRSVISLDEQTRTLFNARQSDKLSVADSGGFSLFLTAKIVQLFLDKEIEVEQLGDKAWEIRVGG